jgi:hexosaminidase
MIDVARNFIPLSIIYDAVDTMSSAKLNVLHLHLSDTQSFPLEIEEMPELS